MDQKIKPNQKSKSRNQIILIIVLVFWHLFIFGQSILPGAQSSEQSNFIVHMIKPVVNIFIPNISIETLSLLIRKGAHITEFFILSMLSFQVYKRHFKLKHVLIIVLIHGFLIAAIDETIQTFTSNRAGLFTDVLIDMIGVFLSVLLIFLISKYKEMK